MKKLFIFGLAVAMLSACGNDPVTNAGYFDDDLDRSIDSSTHDDHSSNTITTTTTTTTTVDDHSNVTIDDHSHVTNNFFPDTVYVRDTIRMRDTVSKTVRDTVRTTDTVTVQKVKRDTVVQHRVDTVKTTVYDTVLSVKRDTVLVESIEYITDTIFSVEPSKHTLKDTSITLTFTLNGASLSKTYYGVVINNVFYDTTRYQFADMKHKKYVQRIFNCTNCTYDRIETAGTSLAYLGKRLVFVNQCGAIYEPNWGLYQATDYVAGDNEYPHIAGWRTVNVSDSDVFDVLLTKTDSVVISTVSDNINGSTFAGSAANSSVVYTIGLSSELTYMCAYDLT